EDVRTTYSLGKELGRGQFGVTHLCTHKATGEKYACKTIAKRKLANKEDIEDVRREVQIMYHLDPWPNISPGAKDLVRKMLNLDPRQRLTAFETY
ncbi:hypothetical protein GW17_00061554, partial [Ensete ventricosum]